MKSSFLSKLDSNVRKLSKGHKKIASYIKENYDKAAFMTASALGRKVGVSESTVVRFATELGFKGYPELQKELQQMIKSKYPEPEGMTREQYDASYERAKLNKQKLKEKAARKAAKSKGAK